LHEKIAKLKEEIQRVAGLEAGMLATPDEQISLTDPIDGDDRSRLRRRRLQTTSSS
jgi:hypothetical protein